MPYGVQWLVPDRAILCALYGVLTADDILAFLKANNAMRDAAAAHSSAEIHVLTDARSMKRAEIGLKDAQGLLKSIQFRNAGWSVYVQPGQLERAVGSLAHHLIGMRAHLCPTMDEAITFLKGKDPALAAITTEQVETAVQALMARPPESA